MTLDRLRQTIRTILAAVSVAVLILAIVAVVASNLLTEARALIEALPETQRAAGERDIMAAAADAVRWDTRIASGVVVLQALALGGALAADVALAAVALWAWRKALEAGR